MVNAHRALDEDLGVVRGAIAPYGAPHQRVECKDVISLLTSAYGAR